MTMQVKSAGIVIVNDRGDFLLLNYPSGQWDFVKGKMEKGETEMQTAIRETFEETGIHDLKFINGFEQTIRYSFHHENNKIDKQVVFFLAQTKTTDVKISHEHRDYMWASFERALERVTFENARRVLTGANNHLSDTRL